MRRVSVVLLAGALAGAAIAALRPARTEPPVPTSVVNSVTSFATNHPEWAVFRGGTREDITPLRLNHKLHLNPESFGMQDSIAALLKGMSPDEAGVSQDAKGLFSLSCGSCHRPDEAGRYMRAVTFDQRCARCHMDALGSVNVAPGVVEAEQAPHGNVSLLASLIDRKLAQAVASSVAKTPPPAESAAPAPEGAPGAAPAAQPAEPAASGSRPGRKKPGAAAAPEGVPSFATREEAAAWIADQRAKTLSRFKTNCGKCHTQIEDAPGGPGGPGFVVTPAKMPEVWLSKAAFAHSPHNMLSCVSCHTKAQGSERTADILLPGIDSCRVCHAPLPAPTGLTRVGVALGLTRPHGQQTAHSTCVTCHNYHDRTGMGGEGRLTIPEFRNSAEPTSSATPAPAPKPAEPPTQK